MIKKQSRKQGKKRIQFREEEAIQKDLEQIVASVIKNAMVQEHNK